MRQPLFVPLFWLCIVCSSHAQDDKPGKVLKVNLNYGQSFVPNRSFTVGDMAPALVLYDKWKHSHELELNRLAIRKTEDFTYDYRLAPIDIGGGQTRYLNHWVKVGGVYERSTVVRLRYQYSFRFRKERRWGPHLGISTLYEYAKSKSQPYVLEQYRSSIENDHPRTGLTFRVNASVVPGVQCRIGKRLVADVNVPVDFLDAFTARYKVNNPNLRPGQQQVWFSDAEFYLPRWLNVRAGVGIKL